ncbi:MAG: hypothetical protein K0S65_1125 [Labilithrix sp.]|nr:hypothetical protein [Labilithrix sp.]
MNRSLLLIVSAALVSALALACSSEPSAEGSSSGTTGPGSSESPSEPSGDDTNDNQDPSSDPNTKKDAGGSKKDSGGNDPPEKDAGPTAFTKAEVQSLFDSRCAPCHVGNATAGLNLATNFTATTVDVDATQVPALKRIAPGNKEQSYLFHKIRGTHASVGGSGVRMPRNATPLTNTEIDRIGAFIDGL